MKTTDFDRILKYFVIPNVIEALNLNGFGCFNQEKITLKSLKSLNAFNKLREFHFLSLEYELKDLIKILKTSNINSLSFTISENHITSFKN